MNERAIVSEKGQVTIPKRLRDRLGIRAGQVLDFHEERGALVATKANGEDHVRQVFGILRDGRPTDHIVDELRGAVDAV